MTPRHRNKNPRRAKRFRVAWHTFHEGASYADGTRAQLRPVIKRLQSERTPFVINDEAGHTVAGGKHKRVKNPRMQNMFVLIAQAKGGTVLKYIGGIRFSTKGRAVLFPSRQAANMAARDLRSRFPILKKYTLSVQS